MLNMINITKTYLHSYHNKNDFKGYVLKEEYFNPDSSVSFMLNYKYDYKHNKVEIKHYNKTVLCHGVVSSNMIQKVIKKKASFLKVID